jgi:hypothetical protein
MGDITSANCVLMLGADSVFPTPQQIQGFSADDIFDVDALAVAETMMGVDGLLSAGFVFEPLRQTIALMAGSASAYVFDGIYQYERQIIGKVKLNGVFKFPSLGIKYTMQVGWLRSYPPMSAARKVLQPKRYTIEWQQCTPSPIIGA